MQEAILSYARCEELAPATRNAGQNRLLALNYIYPGEQPQVSQPCLHTPLSLCSRAASELCYFTPSLACC